MHSPKQVIGEDFNVVAVLVLPCEAGVLQKHMIAGIERLVRTVAGQRRVDSHSLVIPKIAHGVPRVSVVWVSSVVEEGECVTGLDKGVVLGSGLGTQGPISASDIVVFGVVFSVFVGPSNTLRPARSDRNINRLTGVPDTCLFCVSLGGGD